MSGDDAKVDRALKEKCQAAAFRAERVHKWLAPLLRDSLAAKRAYAFKDRVKSDDDIYEKVLNRRNHEDAEIRMPDYEPAKVNDASGFRIVKLFNAEVPQALDQLLSLLRVKLEETAFETGRVKEVVEIEFHTGPLTGPLSIYPAVQDVVGKQKFPLKRPKRNAPPSSYSSVHVLVECELKVHRGDNIVARSEIQLRTVFEEAWSEISHRLNYAPKKSARADGLTSEPENEQLATARLHLDALKSLTDGCAQYADLINRQIQSSTAPSADRLQSSPLDPAGRSAEKFAGYGAAMRAAIRRAYELRSDAVAQTDAERRAGGFIAAANAFEAAMDSFKKDRNEDDERLFDLLREEFAFCSMFSDNKELISRSEATYRKLLAKWPDRISVLLRLGQLRRDAGDLAEAVKLMDDGLSASRSNPDPDEEVNRQAGWLLRRDLAYILWRQVDLEPSRPDAIALLQRAIELSKEALPFIKTDNQYINGRQNYLYYLVELWKRSPADRREPLAATGRELLDDLRPKVDLETSTVETLDTIARGEEAFGDHARALAAAKVIVRKLNELIAGMVRERNIGEGTAFELLSRDQRNMYVHAQLLLASGQA